MLTLEVLEDLNHIKPIETQPHSYTATTYLRTITGSGKSELLITSGKSHKDFIDQMMDGLEL